MDTVRNPSRPARAQIIGAVSLIVLIAVIVAGIFWGQRIEEQNERARCEQSALVQDGTRSVDDCMLVRGYY